MYNTQERQEYDKKKRAPESTTCLTATTYPCAPSSAVALLSPEVNVSLKFASKILLLS